MIPSDRVGRTVALASIGISAALAAAKITVGLKANSTAVVSDGLESASDIFASGVVLFGLIMAAKPADAEHPYGHGRIETLSGFSIGALLVAMGALIGVESLQRITRPHPPPELFAIWPALASVLLKSSTYGLKRHYGRKLRSSGLIADAWNDAMDVLSGGVAMIAVGLEASNPALFAHVDDIGGGIVGAIVIGLGMHIVRDSGLQLIDTMPDPTMLRQIRDVALTVPGALGIEKCFARKTGLRYHVDLHLEVDPEMTVSASHDIAARVRDQVRERLPWVADVLVHVEPYGMEPGFESQSLTPGRTNHGKS